MKKPLKLVGKFVVLGLFLYWLPWLTLFYLACGLYDVSRHRPLTAEVMKKYFFGKGWFVWLLSPLNILFDLLGLPYRNKGIYRLADLPEAYQAEVKELLDIARRERLTERLAEKTQGIPRAMMFWKWYRKDVETSIDVPAFHRDFKYITTIGVSVFNQRTSTSAHFGPLRASYRLLYNLNDMTGKDAYIEVGDTFHYWSEDKLFIFDDTLLHQSHNKTDQARYCLFVDFVRPSTMPAFFRGVVDVLNVLLSSVNSIFYKNWKKVA